MTADRAERGSEGDKVARAIGNVDLTEIFGSNTKITLFTFLRDHLSGPTMAWQAVNLIVRACPIRDGGYDNPAVARALLQQRESIVEECIEAVYRCARRWPHSFSHSEVSAIAGVLRALAARKETPND